MPRKPLGFDVVRDMAGAWQLVSSETKTKKRGTRFRAGG
jgi:hypothetical protein